MRDKGDNNMHLQGLDKTEPVLVKKIPSILVSSQNGFPYNASLIQAHYSL